MEICNGQHTDIQTDIMMKQYTPPPSPSEQGYMYKYNATNHSKGKHI